jgi:hypothetical protein
MNEKIKKSLYFLGLGYMLYFCLGIIPYLGLLIGFKGEKLATIMIFPMIAWWICFFAFIASKDLGNEAKFLKVEQAMKVSYILSIIFCALNIVMQIAIIIVSKKITVLPMILSVISASPWVVFMAILALLSGSMILAPLFMHQFTNADLGNYVKRTTTTYLDLGYSETKVSDRFVKTGQFVRMSLLSSLLSILTALTPAVIIVFIISIIKLKNYKKF